MWFSYFSFFVFFVFFWWGRRLLLMLRNEIKFSRLKKNQQCESRDPKLYLPDQICLIVCFGMATWAKNSFTFLKVLKKNKEECVVYSICGQQGLNIYYQTLCRKFADYSLRKWKNQKPLNLDSEKECLILNFETDKPGNFGKVTNTPCATFFSL